MAWRAMGHAIKKTALLSSGTATESTYKDCNPLNRARPWAPLRCRLEQSIVGVQGLSDDQEAIREPKTVETP